MFNNTVGWKVDVVEDNSLPELVDDVDTLLDTLTTDFWVAMTNPGSGRAVTSTMLESRDRPFTPLATAARVVTTSQPTWFLIFVLETEINQEIFSNCAQNIMLELD